MRYQSKASFSLELLKDMLKVPDGVYIEDVIYNPNRGVVDFHLASSEPVSKITFARGEAQEKIQVGFDLEVEKDA